MAAGLLDECLRIELIGELVQLAEIEARLELAVVRLDDELPSSPGSGCGRRQPLTKRRIEGGLERQAPLMRELLEARGDVRVQGDGRPHESIMMPHSVAVKMTDATKAGVRAPVRMRPTIRALAEPALAAPLQALLSEEPAPLLAAWLFGSRARGEEQPGSDVDVGVLFDRPPEPRLGNEAHQLEGRLEAALGLPVQVVVVSSAPSDLVNRVLREGALLLDRSPVLRVRFEVRSRNEYFDLQPSLALYRTPRGLIDVDLVAKKLAMIETYVRELEELARLDALRTDVREERFVEHTLQIAIQAALDVASHIMSDRRLGEPRMNRELFSLLVRGGVLPEDLAERLGAMAGFRNVLVHGYGDLDLGVVEDVVTNRTGDLLEFVREVRGRSVSR